MTTDSTTRLLMPGRPALHAATPDGDGERGYKALVQPATFHDAVPMLELRLASGDRVAFSYALLSEVAFDPSAGSVAIAFTTGTTVAIRGRHLLPVFAAIASHQAVSVWEADPPTAELAGQGEPVVTDISIDKASL